MLAKLVNCIVFVYLRYTSQLMCIIFVNVGILPDGKYDRNTKIFFCCRSDGSAHFPIALPTSVPFYLLKFGDHCQKVCTGENFDVISTLLQSLSELVIIEQADRSLCFLSA